MKLPLSAFVCSVLVYFRVALSQSTVGAWRILLGFEARYNCFLLEACEGCEEFCAVYIIRKGYQDACSFTLQEGYDRLIVNQPDSDHKWCDSVVRLIAPWEATIEEDRRRVPTC